ncbi:amidohydrolase family protein [Aestuariibacter sp. AA17]|uniref:Amidohydrolase family protein n=1 Tax=Fluctibacter corallii TaxID=2984329 RepID=A0ABT3A5F3_9ALTE|nr:amidohydrolase family protein [Aestuariibacter sp. AA17]MCV2883843.1 amidohydrolase family protein [Aestuariibacter sp. AA17]
MSTVNKSLIAAVVGASLSFVAQVQAENYAITGATVHTMDAAGSFENGTVFIKDGKIEKVIDGQASTDGYTVIDASGKVVTPGLIGALTSLGLEEVSMSAGTVDSRSEARDISQVGAALDVSYAVNPDSSLINISRIEGITSAATSMSRTGQLFGGQGAIITLGDLDVPVIKPRAFVSTSVSGHGADANGGSRASLWVQLETALDEVQAATTQLAGYDKAWHGLLSRSDLKALKPVLDGNVPLLIEANRAADIRQVIGFKQRNPSLNIALINATEAWRVADALAQANIPVILDPESNLPYNFDELGATLENASRLEEAGVMVTIGINTHNIRLAKQHAGNAVANGLSWEQGLAALTINVAKLFGVENTLGSLAPGKRADVVIWSGDPLQVTEAATQVFINGEKIKMESRQSKLRDRYLNLEQPKPMRYVRP